MWKHLLCLGLLASFGAVELTSRDHIAIRGIYGGMPNPERDGVSLKDLAVNAMFLHSGSITEERVQEARNNGVAIYAEFNTMHLASYLEEHPEAAPVGVDGEVSPPPHDWQGICPSHEGYRENRMAAFKDLLDRFDLDGIWLDYHHAHASWERAEPALPDTCFCLRCQAKFARDSGLPVEDYSSPEFASVVLNRYHDEWIRWRCEVFTDWVREFREILDATRPGALLGSYHAPWTDSDFGGARMAKLAIDLKSQARYLDVFSPMVYHARFGHSSDLDWIGDRIYWLGEYLGIEGRPGEDLEIWPIVQLSDWGEEVSRDQVRPVIEQATRRPATGVMVFAWGSLRSQPEKVEALGAAYRDLRAGD